MKHSINKTKISLADQLSSVPPDSLLIRYKDCHDLVIEHLHLRHQAIILGSQLDAKLGEGRGNPARKALNEGRLDYYGFMLIEHLTRNYLAIFQLVLGVWEHVQPFLGLASELELFTEILREHFEVRFRSSVEGYTLTQKKIEQNARAFKQKIYPVLGDPVKVGQMLPKSKKHPWFNLVLDEGRKLAETDTIINDLVHDVDREMIRFVQWHSDFVAQTRQEGSHDLQSKKWQNQRFFTGIKGGYKPTSLQNFIK